MQNLCSGVIFVAAGIALVLSVVGSPIGLAAIVIGALLISSELKKKG